MLHPILFLSNYEEQLLMSDFCLQLSLVLFTVDFVEGLLKVPGDLCECLVSTEQCYRMTRTWGAE